MSLTTVFNLSLAATYAKAKDLSNNPTSSLNISRRLTLANGTGAGKADKLWYDERTLGASATEDLDLVGTQTDDFGDVFSPVRIKGLMLEADKANTNDVLFGAAAGTQWAALLGTTGTLRLRPGSTLVLMAGIADATAYVCAAGATDTLKVANSAGGTSVIYRIVIIGASA
jgi:hypothetical protein